MPDQPAAYFLTFGTYGSWLHGDARGSKDRGHNIPGERPRLRDDSLRKYEERQLSTEAVRVEPNVRTIIERSFGETSAIRGWSLYALNVRVEHIHVVVAATEAPERVLTSLKSHATRALRNSGALGPEERFWSRHGSTRYLWSEADVNAAIEYVLNWQGSDLSGSSWRNWKESGASG